MYFLKKIIIYLIICLGLLYFHHMHNDMIIVHNHLTLTVYALLQRVQVLILSVFYYCISPNNKRKGNEE